MARETQILLKDGCWKNALKALFCFGEKLANLNLKK